MTSYYRYLPTKSSNRSKLRKTQMRRLLFFLLLFLTLVIMSLYEFYFTIVENTRNGVTDASITERVFCQVFMLSVCPKTKNIDPALLDLRRHVDLLNEEQTIRNFDKQGITNDTLVIVIQVHSRRLYVEALVKSLRSVKHINSSIIIFSHDFYNDEINDLVQSIDFAPVMQIFFPFSIQLYPDEFPGMSPNDCVWNIGVDKAKILNCQGSMTPDTYGHFRQGSVTQIKHHWWWKINRVFDHLRITRDFNGNVLFLEEDYLVMPDTLHVLQLMTKLAAEQCVECNSFHVGTHTKNDNYNDNAHKVSRNDWNNLGFAFNRSMWQTLRDCANVFCTFDDYNWDYSYILSAQNCFAQRLTPLVVQSSRIMHIGKCGMHHSSENCDPAESLKHAEDFINSSTPFLFPSTLQLESVNFVPLRVKSGWGGWADPRDIQLCLNISSQVLFNVDDES